MPSSRLQGRGYSLIELLLVLVIVGVLATAGAAYAYSGRNLAVRGMLDELEGVIMSAQKQAVATGQDITLVSSQTWDAATPLVFTFGPSTLSAAQILTAEGNAPRAFRFRPTSRDHQAAGIVIKGSAWWGDASTGNQSIEDVEPFKTQDAFKNAISNESANLFEGATPHTVDISGTSKRFNQTFWIKVVSLKGGQPEVSGPMGLIVVPANGAAVYKFYTPGARGGDKTWRRI